MMKPLNALILAGGQSSRMGRDKALLSFQNTHFLQRIYRIAEQCCNSVYILTPWPERYCNILPDERSFLSESSPGEGSLIALYQGLQQIEMTGDWLLLLACDLPLLDAEILLSWYKNLQYLPLEILACIPKNGDRWEPLCGFYHSQILPDLENYIDRGDRSFQKFLTTIPVSEIILSDREKKMLWNCNTPEDLKYLDSLR
ncbi:MAG: molybdenum cofactor guanylyltransferase [Cyanobacteria bacterium SBLK]|nr:molybdenum cofactor guanylyltransferase [Cyanobacteria bacterium SBLK]